MLARGARVNPARTLLATTLALAAVFVGCAGDSPGTQRDQGVADAASDANALADLGSTDDAGDDQGSDIDQGAVDQGSDIDQGSVIDQGSDIDQGQLDQGAVDQGPVDQGMGPADLGPPCGPSNCAGCCDFFGTCRAGDSFSTCGSGGASCERCSWPESCALGVCEPRTCSATAPSRGADGSDDCGSAGNEYICDCPDNIAGCAGDGLCVSQYETRWRFRVATVQFDPNVTYDPGNPPDVTVAPDPVVTLEFGNTPAYTTDLVEGAYRHEYDPIAGVVRGFTGLPRLRVTLYDHDYPGRSERLQCTFQLDEAADVRARRLVCQEGAVYVELFVEPM